jgi:1,4-dihydroxy-2-naphthoate octaprenyltransferase
VRLGDARTRSFYSLLMLVPFLVSVALAAVSPWLLLGLVAIVKAWPPVRVVRSGQSGPALIPVLKDTALAMLIWAVATTIGAVLS